MTYTDIEGKPLESQMISLSQLAERWAVSKQGLWKQVTRKQIPAVKLGEKWLIPSSWVRKQESPEV